jgi:hypothetical protein
MEVFILDENFQSIYNIDMFESFIWTERFNGAGDFEFYTPVNSTILKVINHVQNKLAQNLDSYVWLRENGNCMIIENLEITTDAESGNHLIMSGRGLESILDRRIIWQITSVSNKSLQEVIQTFINDSIISPTMADRKINNFIFTPIDNLTVTSTKITKQWTGDNVYDTIHELCNTYNIGFDVLLNDQNQFEFKLLVGEDRSYDQDKNPYVVFSPKYENIINSNYLESSKTLKNVTLVAGEGESVGGNRATRIVGSGVGMSRKELYTDARDLQSENSSTYSETTNDSGGTTAYIGSGSGEVSEEYKARLDQRGTEKLAENRYTKTFTGEVEATKSFIYGRDFNKGDIVQIVNEYDMVSKVRVVELIRSQDINGYSVYPTFEVIE